MSQLGQHHEILLFSPSETTFRQPPNTKCMKKKEVYQRIQQQAKAIWNEDLSQETNLCQIAALVKYELDVFWAGFYMEKGAELLLGPFQGEVACQRIAWGRGVCGMAAAEQQTAIVDDVTQFEGYIACHPEPRSEIVVPGVKDGLTRFVLDIDSVEVAFFDQTDREELEELVQWVAEQLTDDQ